MDDQNQPGSPARPRDAQSPPTIRQVAALAGVSTATVSRVLARSGRVSPDLEERVRGAAHQLNYQPNRAARNLRARQGCCLNGELKLELRPSLSGFTLLVPARPDGVGRWPARWLGGLGTPWNTLQLGGSLQLATPGLTLQVVQGRARLSGSMDLTLQGVSSRLSPLDQLGSYRLSVRGDEGSGGAQLNLQTLEGALRLAGDGQWTGARVRFRGQAGAAPGQEGALANLLNIIGRRQGAVAVISIG